MSRLSSSSNLFGSLYDPDRNRTSSVFNQNPTGRAGQAASFAAAQQAERDKQVRQRQEAMAAAEAQNQAVMQEASAAAQRREQARQEALQEQELKLRQAQFDNQRAVEAQQLEEQKRAAAATQAFQQNQTRLSQPSSNQAQYQRALGGDNMAKSMQNHNARLRGQLSPFPELNTAAGNAMEQYFAVPFSQRSPFRSAAGTAADPRSGPSWQSSGLANYSSGAFASGGGGGAFASGGGGGAFGRR